MALHRFRHAFAASDNPRARVPQGAGNSALAIPAPQAQRKRRRPTSATEPRHPWCTRRLARNQPRALEANHGDQEHKHIHSQENGNHQGQELWPINCGDPPTQLVLKEQGYDLE
jgi:hypothetical protein